MLLEVALEMDEEGGEVEGVVVEEDGEVVAEAIPTMLGWGTGTEDKGHRVHLLDQRGSPKERLQDQEIIMKGPEITMTEEEADLLEMIEETHMVETEDPVLETEHQDQAIAETTVQDKNQEETMDDNIPRGRILVEVVDHQIEDNLLMMTEDNHLLQIEDLLLKVETMVKEALGLEAAGDQTMHLELLSRWKMKEDLPLLGENLP